MCCAILKLQATNEVYDHGKQLRYYFDSIQHRVYIAAWRMGAVMLSVRALMAHLKAYAAAQEQQEQQALMLAMLAYKHGLASSAEIALLLEAILAEAQQ